MHRTDKKVQGRMYILRQGSQHALRRIKDRISISIQCIYISKSPGFNPKLGLETWHYHYTLESIPSSDYPSKNIPLAKGVPESAQCVDMDWISDY